MANTVSFGKVKREEVTVGDLTMQASTLETVLESIDALSLEEQEMVVDLVRRRIAERRRAEVAANIAQAKTDYNRGQVFRGTPTQVIEELQK